MDILLLHDHTTGEKVRTLRLDRRLTQAELAYLSTEPFRAMGFPKRKVTPLDVGFLEKDWRIFPAKHQAILQVLGLSDE